MGILFIVFMVDYKCVRIHEYKGTEGMQVHTLNTNDIKIKPGFVLVKVHYAVINPNDNMFSTGKYKSKKTLPAVMGFEGVGEIIKLGGGFMPWWVGKGRVSFVCDMNNPLSGSW